MDFDAIAAAVTAAANAEGDLAVAATPRLSINISRAPGNNHVVRVAGDSSRDAETRDAETTTTIGAVAAQDSSRRHRRRARPASSLLGGGGDNNHGCDGGNGEKEKNKTAARTTANNSRVVSPVSTPSTTPGGPGDAGGSGLQEGTIGIAGVGHGEDALGTHGEPACCTAPITTFLCVYE